MATKRVVMPQLGESVHEGTISKWLVKPGDKVVEFEPMLEVDTDKVSAEVPAPVTGILREILAKEGQTVQAGAEIAVVEVGGDGEAVSKAETAPAGSSPPAGEVARSAGGATEPGQTDSRKAPPAEATPEAPTAAAKEAPTPRTSPSSGAPAPEAREVSPGSRSDPRGGGGAETGTTESGPANAETPSVAPEPAAASAPPLETGEHRYSPAVQMVASELKVDLSRVTGTGIGGRVTKKDVQDFAVAPKTTPAAPGAAPGAPAAPAVPSDGDHVVQLTRVRRLIAENMTRSKTTIPHAWQTQEVDMSSVVANRAANKAAFQKQEGFSLTYLPYVMAATVSALREHPEVNSTFNETELIVHRDINLGVSVGLEDTLVVPVVRRADGLSIAGLAREVNDVATRARSKQLKADDLAGGTFTVNNSGTFGTLFSYSVINPGQAGILTMEAIVERPVAVDGMIGIKPMMYLCFSFDHRVLDGLMAARFLVSCRKWLEAVTAESPIY
ncbi:MAG: 2-oxo acid dehydrogenase subunit E2 [Candidatus Dormibacteraeota bacterium]|nr:2-oxo acid dehydrogenase subunit E2 [Candidatus Dormibacteraeota bacterium]